MKKRLGHGKRLNKPQIFEHILAASTGEIVSCIVRVPYEIIKMRAQTSREKLKIFETARSIVAVEGFAGLYRGFTSTVARDVPFSALQYPIWEYLKLKHVERYRRTCSVAESAWYGSIAGGFAAFLTNPLDVAKTRIMLADPREKLASGHVLAALIMVKSEKGFKGLFAGVVPRVLWISIGAAIFLGSYEKVIKLL